MTEIRFYHLQRTTLERALPQLLEKILERGMHTLIICGSAERVEFLDQHLWTYNPASFLPHGKGSDSMPEDQPIWLTFRDENPNKAKALMLLDGMDSAHLPDYDICCVIFDGNDEHAVIASRERWKTYQKANHALSYWQQTENGWKQKNT